MRTTFSTTSIEQAQANYPNRAKQPASKKEKNTGSTILKFVFSIIWMLLIGVFTFAMVNGLKDTFQIVKDGTINVITKTVWTEMKTDINGNVNILLLWYGWEGHDWGFLTDSIIIASRNPELWTLSMFSVPRDLWVKYPTGGYGRINADFYLWLKKTDNNWEDATSWVKADMWQMLWLDIPYYATIDFSAFREIVDIIWGIDIVVPETIHDTTYPNEANRWYITFHIDAGEQHLDWDTALKYARSRHSTSDFSRSLRQQIIIQGIKQKMMWSGLTVNTAGELYNLYTKYIHTNVSAQEMLWTTQFINRLGDFASLGLTTNCGFQSIIRMVPACFLYYPEREYFGGASVMLPMNATANNVQHYGEIQKFVRFVTTNSRAIQDKASIEVVSAIDTQKIKDTWKSKVKFADQMWVKLKRYGLNIISTMIWADPQEKTTLVINNIWDYTATIDALKNFVPSFDIYYNTWNIQSWWDENWNEITFVDGADLQLVLWDDYLLGNAEASGYIDTKFSYEL